MTRQVRHPADESQITVPKALKDDLVELYGADVAIPPAQNEAILAMARQHMARRLRLRLILRRSFNVAAVAAVLALAFLLIRPDPRSNAPSAPVQITQNEPKPASPNAARLAAPNEPKPSPSEISPSPSEISNLQSEISPPTPSRKAPAPGGIAERNEPKLAESADPKDIDHNGQVNILDAFFLARRIEDRLESRADALVGPRDGARKNKRDRFVFEPTPVQRGGATTTNGTDQKTNLSRLSGDVNGDGVIDNGDVDAVAMAAVRLKGGAL